MTAPSLFTIQPGGAVPSQPLPISFPNVTEASPGRPATLWFLLHPPQPQVLLASNATTGNGTV